MNIGRLTESICVNTYVFTRNYKYADCINREEVRRRKYFFYLVRNP